MNLTWREATKRDRPLLQRFTCTVPAPRDPDKRAGPHPKPYEREVEKAIRALPVPLSGADGVALLGFDEVGELVTVAAWCSIIGTPGLYKVRLLAVARGKRGAGGLVARACLDEVLRRIASEHPGATVFGLVDERNTNSQRLMMDRGFSKTPGPVDDPRLEMWAAALPR